jgi:Predicted O-methyltransferase
MTTKAKSFSKLAKKAIIHLSNAVGIKIGRHQPTDALPKAIDEHLATLDPRFRSPLLSMFLGESQLGTDGQPHPIDKNTKISPSQGMWLYDLCVSVRPKSTLEIGMAYGYSTIFFLAAIEKNQAGHHTSVDPFQRSHYHGIGLTHAQALATTKGSNSAFSFIEDRSDRVAIDLARSHTTFDIIFIDGNHRFDDVLVDFYLYAPLCTIGGHIIFDDMWMSSIQTVAAFVLSNRADFVEVRTSEPNISVFQRVGDDARKWSHFRNFTVSRSTS